MKNKINERLSEYIKYLKYIKPYIKYEIMILILVYVSSILALANPILLQIIIDRVLVLKEVYLLKYIIIASFVFYIVNVMMTFSSGFLGNYVGQMISIKLRKDLFGHIQKLKLKEMVENKVGDFITKISDDVATISGFLSGTFISTASDTFNLLASAGLMLYFSVKLSLIAIFITIIQLYISMKFSKITRQNQKELRETASVHISFLKQIMSSVKYIKAYQAEKKNEIKYFGLLKKLQNLSFKNFYIYFSYGTCMSFASFVGSILIFSIGVHEILKGNMSVGALFVFDTVSEQFYQFAGNIVNLNVSLQGVVVAFERVNSIFGLETEDYDYGKKEFQANSIEFQNVLFSYNNSNEKNILNEFSIFLREKETYALVGASGDGKSTLISLLMHFYETDSGDIYIGDSRISEINIKSLRKKISLVSQEPMLDDGTIEENIRYGNKTASFDEIIRVSKICGIHQYIDSLPDKYNTLVGEGGSKLSGGQKQRISIARGILRNADIYIFDEALSSLDKKMESEIFNNLQKELEDKTKIFVTHNIQLIRNLQNIIVLNNGKVEAVGNHTDLLNCSQTYKQFYSRGEKRNEKN